MRKSQSYKLTLFLVLLLSAGLIGTLDGCVSSAEERDYGHATNAMRIMPTDVNLSNVEAFEKQTREDLPAGTPERDVERYIKQWKVPYYYAGNERFPNERGYYVTLKNIGVRMGFVADLNIRVHIDPEGKVEQVTFRIQYL